MIERAVRSESTWFRRRPDSVTGPEVTSIVAINSRAIQRWMRVSFQYCGLVRLVEPSGSTPIARQADELHLRPPARCRTRQRRATFDDDRRLHFPLWSLQSLLFEALAPRQVRGKGKAVMRRRPGSRVLMG